MTIRQRASETTGRNDRGQRPDRALRPGTEDVTHARVEGIGWREIGGAIGLGRRRPAHRL
jgi:hypothetical protein